MIHKQVHQYPFTLPARCARSAQWRAAANRKRKALAVLRFAKAGADGGLYQVDSASHARTRDILGADAAEDGGSGGGHEGVPWTEPGDQD